ncbi:MAG TPA: PhzF family phenazine biosynthesis protein [Myxococcales bacterium]|jgi:PhzF family phenazine biosynthesis protein
MTLRIPLYQVDAFAERVFQGNPAAVCPLERWLPDETLQAIASENNCSETAFLVQDESDYHLRFFTPSTEVDLCGHTTLASAFVLFHRLAPDRESVTFHTQSGPLRVTRKGDLLEMDLPSRPPTPSSPPPELDEALGVKPREVLEARDLLCVLDSERAVRELRPDMTKLAALDLFAVIVTAPADPGRGVDFVSRFFAPTVGVPEDPVTGSSHSTLVPYWAARLGRGSGKLVSEQVSARGGRLECRLEGDRVHLGGQCVPFLEGVIALPDQ